MTLDARLTALTKLLHRLGVSFQYDHRPPLSDRKFDTIKCDTIPPANDPQFIEAITVKEHDERTNGPRPGEKRITTVGSDAHRRAQTRHIREREALFRERRRIILEPRSPDDEQRTLLANYDAALEKWANDKRRKAKKKWKWPSRKKRSEKCI